MAKLKDEKQNMVDRLLRQSIHKKAKELLRNGEKLQHDKFVADVVKYVANDLGMSEKWVVNILLLDKITSEHRLEEAIEKKIRDSIKISETQPDGSKKVVFVMKEHELAVKKEMAKAKKMEKAWAKYDKENPKNLEKQIKEIKRNKK